MIDGIIYLNDPCMYVAQQGYEYMELWQFDKVASQDLLQMAEGNSNNIRMVIDVIRSKPVGSVEVAIQFKDHAYEVCVVNSYEIQKSPN